MPGRVCVHLVALGGIEISSWLERSGTEGDCLVVRGSRILDVQVEMYLRSVDDAVPIVVLKDLPAEYPCPKRALGMQVGRIEHDRERPDVDVSSVGIVSHLTDRPASRTGPQGTPGRTRYGPGDP